MLLTARCSSIIPIYEDDSISGRNRNCALGGVLRTALPRPQIASSGNRRGYHCRRCAPTPQAPTVRRIATLFFRWQGRLGRHHRQKWRIPHQTPSARHLPSRSTRMGQYNDPHQCKLDQTTQRTNAFLLSATHGRRVHWNQHRHKLTDCCHVAIAARDRPTIRFFDIRTFRHWTVDSFLPENGVFTKFDAPNLSGQVNLVKIRLFGSFATLKRRGRECPIATFVRRL